MACNLTFLSPEDGCKNPTQGLSDLIETCQPYTAVLIPRDDFLAKADRIKHAQFGTKGIYGNGDGVWYLSGGETGQLTHWQTARVILECMTSRPDLVAGMVADAVKYAPTTSIPDQYEWLRLTYEKYIEAGMTWADIQELSRAMLVTGGMPEFYTEMSESGFIPVSVTYGMEEVMRASIELQRGVGRLGRDVLINVYGTRGIFDAQSKRMTGFDQNCYVLSATKDEFVRRHAAKYRIETRNSVAIGDTHGDYAMYGEIRSAGGLPVHIQNESSRKGPGVYRFDVEDLTHRVDVVIGTGYVPNPSVSHATEALIGLLCD